MATTLKFGWNPALDIPSALRVVSADLRPPYALISVIDSTPKVRTLPTLVPLLRDIGEFHVGVDDDVAIKVPMLLRLAHDYDFLNGFDEVWLCTDLPRAGKPEHLRITSDRPIGPGPPSGIAKWMRETHCVAGLGDGHGLNFVTEDHWLASLWQATDAGNS